MKCEDGGFYLLLTVICSIFASYMEIISTAIPGVIILRPQVFEDKRGYFFESFSQRDFERAAGKVCFVQDNESMSRRGVVRGLHFQCPPYAQAKLVRCVRGCVFDVAVDIRRGSPTYGQYVAVELTDTNRLQIYMPAGIAHGFAVISDEAVFQYKCNNYYAPESDMGIDALDPALDINWPFAPSDMILSDKDMHHRRLDEIISPFEFE